MSDRLITLVSVNLLGLSRGSLSRSVLVLTSKSLPVTSMATALLWHWKQYPKDNKRSELQSNNNPRLIFYLVGSECLAHGANVLLLQTMKGTIYATLLAGQ